MFMHAVDLSFALPDHPVELLADARTTDECDFVYSSTSKKVATAVKDLFKIILLFAQFIATMTPFLSTLTYLPLAAYHGLYATRENGDGQKRQIQNALACCILAVPLLGQFYFLKALTKHTIKFSFSDLETGKIIARVASTDLLFCLVVAYWFAESELHEAFLYLSKNKG
jgi:hypothetical protein